MGALWELELNSSSDEQGFWKIGRKVWTLLLEVSQVPAYLEFHFVREATEPRGKTAEEEGREGPAHVLMSVLEGCILSGETQQSPL